jgi:hypothetical protein
MFWRIVRVSSSLQVHQLPLSSRNASLKRAHKPIGSVGEYLSVRLEQE